MTATAWILALAAASTVTQLRYDKEYPKIGYASSSPRDAIAHLQQRIDTGDAQLEFEASNGYLSSVLRELDIDVDSQILVFSKTSFQKGLIAPETPRAIYFKDDAYVAWVQQSPSLEISTMAPELGAVFYTLEQTQSPRPTFERQTFLCLRCHDSYSLTGGGVPRHIMGSGLPDASGRPAYHEGWYLTTEETPIDKRWGGFYVTGTHGSQSHLGNVFVTAGPGGAASVDFTAGANRTDLSELIDAGPYLGDHSDIVALMVIEHQIHVQNLITRVSWDWRSVSTSEPPKEIAEPLVEAMLLAHEAELEAPIAGGSNFAETFAAKGPRDSKGRSLRQLDLTTRLFRYPCSYLIYSKAFDALPGGAKTYVYERFREVLGGEDRSESFAHLTRADRAAILEILTATKSDFAGQ